MRNQKWHSQLMNMNMCAYNVYIICYTNKISSPYLDLDLAVVLEDIGGGAEVQHPVDDQLTVAGQLVALPLEKS